MSVRSVVPGPASAEGGGGLGKVCLYDAVTGAEFQRLPGVSHYNVHAEFAPDGRTVAYSRLEPD
jgi:hypothetical protein